MKVSYVHIPVWTFHLFRHFVAITHIRSMQKAPDFDRKMLLLATQISHKLEMKPVLLSALEALLNTLKSGANTEAVVEAMTLIRCIIKMAMKLLLDPVANRSVLFQPPVRRQHSSFGRPVLMDTVVSHFRTGTCNLRIAVHARPCRLMF